MVKLSNFVKGLVKEMASPIIFRLLEPFNSIQLERAVEEDVDLAEKLREDEEYLKKLRVLLFSIPYHDKVGRYVSDKKYIDWFVENELAHERQDLYAVFAYKPKSKAWLYRQVRNIAELLFT
jgi:hypothetical protein